MVETPRPHTAPPERAKDILGKLDNARATVGRARMVAQRSGFTQAEARLATAEQELAQIIADIEIAVRTDVRRLLAGGQAGVE